MNVVELFANEHALFRALLDRLELVLTLPIGQSRPLVEEALRFLLPSLDRHAEIEDIVFLQPPDLPTDSGKALAEIDDQHCHLASLRADVLLALEQSPQQGSDERLPGLLHQLARDLRHHLRTEEERLWPLYQTALSRPLNAVAPIPIEGRANALEKALALGVTTLESRRPAGDGGQ